jgi:arginine utilization regulatory protein
MLSASEQWLEAIFNTIDEGIHAVDLTGTTIVYNDAAGRLDGLAPSDVLGKHILSVFPSLGEETSTLLKVLHTGRPIYNRAQTYTNFLGVKVHTVNTTLPIVSEGRVVGAVEIAKDLTQVKHLSEQLIDLQAQVISNKSKRKPGTEPERMTAVYDFSHIVTHDRQMQELKRRAQLVAGTSSPILVYGETGTGKELLVQSIHNASQRYHHPFLALNCAALPSSLLEGILFGTVRGSFTGAEDRPGLFELADEGTLFLDEIQSMPLDVQSKLLRVLQEGEVMRVGDTRVRQLNVRVIAAMNQPPETAVERGLLRQDLYYRINVVRFDIPPLRDRQNDILLLADHFIRKLNLKLGRAVRGVSPAVRDLFLHYPWPGNVRELQNAIEAALNVVSTGDIEVDALPAAIRDWGRRASDVTPPQASQGTAENLAESRLDRGRAGIVANGGTESAAPEWAHALESAGMSTFWDAISSRTGDAAKWKYIQSAFERIVLQKALSSTGHNVKLTADMLGIPRQTLQYRIRQLGL